MALTTEIGSNFLLKLDGLIYGCAQTIKFGASITDVEATCSASQGVVETVPGKKSYTLTADALMRVATGGDAAGNVTSKTIEEHFEARTIFDWEFTSTTVGATSKKGKAYVKSFEETGGSSAESAAFSVAFTVTGPVTYSDVTA